MVVTWSFFIGCDLHVATLSEIGRTSCIYIFSDGDILHGRPLPLVVISSDSIFSITEDEGTMERLFFLLNRSIFRRERGGSWLNN